MSALERLVADVTNAADPEKVASLQASLAGVLDEVDACLRRYIHFTTDDQVCAVTLWAAYTHVFRSFDIAPRLAIRAPTRGSGKTQLARVLTELVSEGWYVIGPSEAVLFRKIDASHPTILLDEADRLFEKRTEDTAGIVQVINAGHIREATVPRVVGVGTKQTVKDFDAWSPMTLVGIGKNWPDTVLDRSIVITLEVRKASELIDPFRHRDRAVPRAIGTRLGDHLRVLSFTLPAALPELTDRQADNWEALIAIADAAGGDWPERARQAARTLSREHIVLMADDERDEVHLLGDVIALMRSDPDPDRDFFGSAEVNKALLDDDDLQWADYRKHGLTSTMQSRMLKVLGVPADKPFGSSKRGYSRKKAEAVWSRVGARSAV